MSTELVVLRRDGALWGVRGDAVTGIDAVAAGVRLHLAGGGELAADAVEGLARGATVRGVPAAVRRRLPVALEGLALWEHRPLAVPAVPAGGVATEAPR